MVEELQKVVRKDPLVKGLLLFHALLASTYFLPLTEESRQEALWWQWDLFLPLLTVGILFLGTHTLQNRTERHFWRYLASGFFFWFLANSVWLLRQGQVGSGPADVLIDSLYLAYYLSLVFATELRADHVESVTPRSVEKRLNLWGAVLFTFALLLYFVHLPSNLDPQTYGTWRAAPLLYVWLDLFFVGRFAYLTWDTRSPRWKVLYGTLLFSFCGFAIADGLDTAVLLLQIEAIPKNYGSAWDLFWILPFLLVMTTARMRHHLPEELLQPPTEEKPEGVTSLWLYTAAFPFMHLVLHSLETTAPIVHLSRDLLVLLYLLVLGAMAVVQHRYRERRRKEAERRLLESEDNYRQLVESARDAILVIAKDTILYANSRACQLFELEHIPIAGSFGRLGLPHPETLSPTEEGILETVVPGHQLPYGPATPTAPRRLEVTYGAISYLEQDAWQLIVRNTTFIERLRQQDRRLQRLAAIGELAAGFADEIRPALDSLSDNWNALSPSTFSADDRADVELAIERIQRIVGNVHNFSHLEQANRGEHDLGDLIEEAIRPLRERFALSSITFEEQLAHHDARVLADRHQILQVFTNLLENARLAMPEGGTIRVSTRNEAGTLEIRIFDSGEGISKENLERIFDPFYTTRRGGTGLGLAVVSQILGQHECWHAVESEPGQGTSFILTFPLQRLRAAG